ncbi:hypothetical protein [Nocardia caishijiensis]|uniref:Excreted virulence factor EspC (Type VII ESX diderm) n=1 Tax=Nocardia caishijiensis TaxID=184756 RepID=A0ABQ6YR20_9NOCA|nr:hypothetical protein [Nocardia caishijiensis]KAF0848282.1 hypothetical protein FNL39_102430 [Nocardia caishijiensis]
MAALIRTDASVISNYGATNAAMATQVAAAGAADAGASMAAAVPIFGLIGQDFLAAFAVAQGNNLASVTEIAAVHAGTALVSAQAVGAIQLDEQVGAAVMDAQRVR